MRTLVTVIAIALAATPAWAEPAPADDEGIEPRTAQWISLGASAGGLALSGYFWHHATTLEEGHGRDENFLYAASTATLTLGVGPMVGLLAAGERRRALVGGIARPLGILAAAGGTLVGAAIIGFGCFETDDCTGAKVGGFGFIGVSAVLGAAMIGWAAYDLVDTPRIVRTHRAKQRTTATLAPILGGDRAGLALTIVH